MAQRKGKDTKQMEIRVKELGKALLSGASPDELANERSKRWLIPVKEAQRLVNIALNGILRSHARTRSHALVDAINLRQTLLDRLLPDDGERIDAMTARTALAIADSHSKLLRLFDSDIAMNELLATIEGDPRLNRQPYQMSLELVQELSYAAIKELGKQAKSKDPDTSYRASVTLIKAAQDAHVQLELLDRIAALEGENADNSIT